jgi:glutamate formiminotransferase/formiminotetrahydrofolate cyclodeaminase
MVANLSANKRGWDDRWEEFSDWADKGQTYHTHLLALVDADTAAFNGIMDAYGLPKSSEDQILARSVAIQAATKHAIDIPMQVAEIAHNAFEVAEAMAQFGNPNSITDAGVGAMCLRTAVLGAILNARVNTADLNDTAFVSSTLARCSELLSSTKSREAAILARVDELLG